VRLVSLKLDETDVLILKALMEDGRKPFRQIARMASVSTPTVESRLRRMIGTGLIRKIAPIIDPNKIEQGITSLISLHVDSSKIDSIANELSGLEEVRNVYLMIGESNLVIRVVAQGIPALQELMTERISKIEGVAITSSHVIAKTVKEEQGALIRPGTMLRLRCAYCNKQITGESSILRVGNSERYFCCPTCLESYKEKYGSRLKMLAQ